MQYLTDSFNKLNEIEKLSTIEELISSLTKLKDDINRDSNGIKFISLFLDVNIDDINEMKEECLLTDDYTTEEINTMKKEIAAAEYKMKMFNEVNNVTIDTEKYFEPDEDYDSFCENNKKNETLRALSSFYVNLMKENIIDKEYIEKAIFKLFEILNSMINLNTKKNELDELAELLYIIITNSYENIKEQDPDIAKNIYDNIDNITKLKVKDYTGLTNKCVFKHMDILDEIS